MKFELMVHSFGPFLSLVPKPPEYENTAAEKMLGKKGKDYSKFSGHIWIGFVGNLV